MGAAGMTPRRSCDGAAAIELAFAALGCSSGEAEIGLQRRGIAFCDGIADMATESIAEHALSLNGIRAEAAH